MSHKPVSELTEQEMSRAVSGRVMMRLKQGDFRDGSDVVLLRKYLAMMQEQFALALGISVSTLRGWEQGTRNPEGPAIALLSIAARHPQIIRERLGLAFKVPDRETAFDGTPKGFGRRRGDA